MIFICPYCGRELKTKNALQRHKRPYEEGRKCKFPGMRLDGTISRKPKKYIPKKIKTHKKIEAVYDEETLEWLEQRSDSNMLNFFKSTRKLRDKDHRKLKEIRIRVDKRQQQLKNRGGIIK